MGEAGPPGRIRVPVGDDAARWTTRSECRRVLLVVHNVTSGSRLLDILPLFHDDLRVQLLLTCTGSSAFQAGVPELIAETGLPVLPWEQSLSTPVDLVISASFGGELDLFTGQLAILSHGIGYTKRLATPDAGRRTPDAGRRTPDAGRRTPDAGRRTPDAGRLQSSASRPSGCFRTAPHLRTPWFFPIPNSSTVCGIRVRRPLPQRYWPETPASTGCSRLVRTANGSAERWVCAAVSGSLSSIRHGTRKRSSVTAGTRTFCRSCSHG